MAIIIGCGNLSGLVSSNVYPNSDAPWYRTGHSIILGFLFILVGGSTANCIFLSIANKRREKVGQELREEKLSGLTQDEEDDLADSHPDFRYVL